LIALAAQAESAAHWSAREYENIFLADTPLRCCLVAFADDRPAVAGFVVARCGPGDWEIENVVVGQSLRRRGWAERLIREVLLAARRASAPAVLLEVRESNLAARQLYGKLGFASCGRRRAYYRQPAEDALLLRLELQPGDKSP
jgi:ribosomal-protein-alanine N-acetyltransferase